MLFICFCAPLPTHVNLDDLDLEGPLTPQQQSAIGTEAAALSEARTKPVGTWRPAPPSRHESCYGTEGRLESLSSTQGSGCGGPLFRNSFHGGWGVLAAMFRWAWSGPPTGRLHSHFEPAAARSKVSGQT